MEEVYTMCAGVLDFLHDAGRGMETTETRAEVDVWGYYIQRTHVDVVITSD